MKPSHLHAPRQLADATFVTGQAGIHSSAAAADRVLRVLAAFVVGLILGGVL